MSSRPKAALAAALVFGSVSAVLRKAMGKLCVAVLMEITNRKRR